MKTPAQIWSGTMMLQHLGHSEAGHSIEEAIEALLAQPAVHSPDLGGNATTRDVGEAIAHEVSAMAGRK